MHLPNSPLSLTAIKATALASLLLSTAASAETIRIDVGKNGQLVFDPDSVTAQQGDVLEYHFHGPLSHDVVMGQFARPCAPASTGGFYSGLVSVRGDGEGPNVFRVTVNSTTSPIFFYCSVANHCPAGMSGVVNPPSSGDQTLAEYKDEAEDADGVTPTGGVFGGVLAPAGSSSSSSTTTSGGGASSTGGGGGGASSTGGGAGPSATPSSAGGGGGDGNGGVALGVSYVGVLGGLVGIAAFLV